MVHGLTELSKIIANSNISMLRVPRSDTNDETLMNLQINLVLIIYSR